MPVQEKRTPPAIEVIKAPPPEEIVSRLHTVSWRNRLADHALWLQQHGYKKGYIHEDERGPLLSYFECDRIQPEGDP